VVARGIILVVEDDDHLRKTIVEVLTHSGHRVIQAKDGEDALELLAAQPVEVLVLDLAMPRIDGVSVLRELRDSKPTVILHSAFEYYSVEQLAKLGLSTRVFRTLRKPVPVDQLLKAVADALNE
jgi:two-component system, chemotaxis family, chemotaxis protein CheY